MKHFKYGMDDIILCEVCTKPAVDIHHIDSRGMGGSKSKDYIENLIALCRNCHNDAHANKITKDELRDIHTRTLDNAD